MSPCCTTRSPEASHNQSASWRAWGDAWVRWHHPCQGYYFWGRATLWSRLAFHLWRTCLGLLMQDHKPMPLPPASSISWQTLQNVKTKPGAGWDQTCNLGISEVEAGGLLGVWGQFGLHNWILPKKKKNSRGRGRRALLSLRLTVYIANSKVPWQPKLHSKTLSEI